MQLHRVCRPGLPHTALHALLQFVIFHKTCVMLHTNAYLLLLHRMCLETSAWTVASLLPPLPPPAGWRGCCLPG